MAYDQGRGGDRTSRDQGPGRPSSHGHRDRQGTNADYDSRDRSRRYDDDRGARSSDKSDRRRRTSRSRSPIRRKDGDRRNMRERSPPRGPRGALRPRSPPETDMKDSRSRDYNSRSSATAQGKTNGATLTTHRETEPTDPNEDPEITAMRRVMGFSRFRSTKNTKVPGNDKNYAVAKTKKTEYRQYMNRTGGFNRPLSPTRF